MRLRVLGARFQAAERTELQPADNFPEGLGRSLEQLVLLLRLTGSLGQ
jgi:hypothetical protein